MHHFNAKDNRNKDPPSNVFEPHTASSSSPPLEEDHPFSCLYLLNLVSAPDMTRYLAEATVSDDVYNLPLHLQKLLCEARMEVALASNQSNCSQAGSSDCSNSAVKRLEKVREYIKTVAHHDTAAVIDTLNELIHDDDAMSTILEKY